MQEKSTSFATWETRSLSLNTTPIFGHLAEVVLDYSLFKKFPQQFSVSEISLKNIQNGPFVSDSDSSIGGEKPGDCS